MKVLVFGTFDHLHPGHLFLLREAGKRGKLIVVIARDRNVWRIKGHRPAQNEQERMRAVKNAFPHAKVVLGDPEDFLAPVRSFHPDLILLGYDQNFPPGVSRNDFHCPVERLPAYEPGKFKSSLRRKR